MTGGTGGGGILRAAGEIFRGKETGGNETGRDGRSATALLAIALASVVAFRLYLLVTTDFPLGDGGLFLEFIRNIADAFPRIPATASYNGLSIPFAYPPLSFWTGALLTKLGFDALEVVRVLPILMNIVYATLFALLLVRSGHGRIVTALALVFFLVSARSYEWLVMGGGMSRGFGSIFLLLALLAVGIPRGERRPPLSMRQLVLTGAAVGAAILSHLEWGLLAAVSVVLSLILGCRTLRDLIRSCLITGVTASLLVVPWVAMVIGTHGVEPFVAAGQTSQNGLVHSLQQLLWLIRSNIFNIFIALGGAALLWRRQFFWIGFFLLCVFVTPRHGPTPVVLPLCIFVGEGLIAAFRILQRVTPSRAVAAGVTGVVFAGVLVAQVARERAERLQLLRALSNEQRGAMAWVRRNQPGARLALITSLPWQSDSSAEWFPVLAGATSTTTVQGREWLPKGEFKDREDKVLALKESDGCSDLVARLTVFEPAQFIWAEESAHCFAAPAYAPVFRNAGVTIFRVNGTARGKT